MEERTEQRQRQICSAVFDILASLLLYEISLTLNCTNHAYLARLVLWVLAERLMVF